MFIGFFIVVFDGILDYKFRSYIIEYGLRFNILNIN